VKSLGLEPGPLAQVKSEIDRKDMRALGAKLDALGVHASVQTQVSILARCVGDAGVLKAAYDTIVNDESRAAIADLDNIGSGLAEWRDRIVFDLTEIDEMEYYSGVMFTFFSPSHSGELGKGGRYDMLLKEFGLDLPAVGFSLSIDRISECL
jgi:ATP phosphoribosyltransferase regulatory subunit